MIRKVISIFIITAMLFCVPNMAFADEYIPRDMGSIIAGQTYEVPFHSGTFVYSFTMEKSGPIRITAQSKGASAEEMESEGLSVSLANSGGSCVDYTSGGALVYPLSYNDTGEMTDSYEPGERPLFYGYEGSTYQIIVYNYDDHLCISSIQVDYIEEKSIDVDLVSSDGSCYGSNMFYVYEGIRFTCWIKNDFFAPIEDDEVFDGFYLGNSNEKISAGKYFGNPDEDCYLDLKLEDLKGYNYIEARYKKIEKPVEKQTQTITGTSTYNKKLSDGSFKLDAVTNGDGTLSYVSSNPSVATVSANGVVTPKSKGSAVITVTASETDKFKSAQKKITINVTDKMEQVLTGTNSYNKIVGDKAFQLDIRNSGDGRLTYTTDNASVATVSSTGLVSVKGAGTARITVKAAETANYNAAEKTVFIQVEPKKETAEVGAVKDFLPVLGTDNKSLEYEFTEVEDCDGYKISYCYNGGTWRTLEKTTISQGVVDISNLSKGKKINVKVAAYKVVDGKTVYGKASEIYEIKRVLTPTLKAKKMSRTKVKLSWKSTVSADGYEVYRKIGKGNYRRIASTKKNSYINKSLKKGKTYSYYLKPYQINDYGDKVYGKKSAVKKVRM